MITEWSSERGRRFHIGAKLIGLAKVSRFLLAPRLGLALGCLLNATGASAEGAQTRTIDATFDATPGCGDLAVLKSRFESRVPDWELLLVPEAPVQFTVKRTDSGASAQLLILLDGGEELSRSIEAESCKAAVEAIAFIASVALDPGGEQPLQVRQGEPSTKSLEKTPEEDKRSSEEPEHSAHRHRFWSLGAGATAHQGQAPDFLLGGLLSLENASDHAGWWAPSARLAPGYSRRGDFVQSAGLARFELMAASLDVCPSQLKSAILRLQICTVVEGGVLVAQGIKTHEPTRSERPWLAGGAALYSDILIAGPIALNYRAAVLTPAIRDEFQFDEAVFHRVSPITLQLNAGLSWRIE